MRNWDDIEKLIGNAPRSNSYQVYVDELNEMVYDTINESVGKEFDADTEDFEITEMFCKNIEFLKDKYNDRELYVRVYPEIRLNEDKTKKYTYMRLQFVDKNVVKES